MFDPTYKEPNLNLLIDTNILVNNVKNIEHL